MVLKKLVPRVMREDADYDGENLTSPQGREGGKIILQKCQPQWSQTCCPWALCFGTDLVKVDDV